MKVDPRSLENLQDISTPAPVPWWPPAAGWWVIFGVLTVAALAVGWLAWRRWRATAYRRAAMRELESAATIVEIAEILKRTALCAYPRTDIAGLTGDAWVEWLVESVEQEVSKRVSEALTQGVFAKSKKVNVDELRRFANHWIQNHAASA